MPSALVVRVKEYARQHPLIAYGVPALAGGILVGFFLRALDYKAYSDGVNAGWGAPKANIWGLSVGDFDRAVGTLSGGSASCDDGFAIGSSPPPNSSGFVQDPPGCWKLAPPSSGCLACHSNGDCLPNQVCSGGCCTPTTGGNGAARPRGNLFGV